MTSSLDQRPPLDGRLLASVDPDLVPGLTIELLEETTSTNAVVVERARAGAPHGLIVVAEHQTAGRGRLDRSWEMPPRAGLTFSMLLRPTVPTRSWPWLPLLTGYALAKALVAQGYAAGVKWPNDVLIGEHKVAGILVERIELDDGPVAVVGVGLNVSLAADELPVPTATSLLLESAGPAGTGGPASPAGDRTALLVSLLQGLQEAYDAWAAGGEEGGVRLADSYTAACVTVGRRVRVDLPSGDALVGLATGIDPSGRLLVQPDPAGSPGGPVAVSAGDVVHVRDATPRS